MSAGPGPPVRPRDTPTAVRPQASREVPTTPPEGSYSPQTPHELRLARVPRATDFPFTYLVINPINRALLRPLHAMRVSPMAVTVAALWLAIATAYLLGLRVAGDVRAGWIALGLAFLSHILDALDGDLARYSARESEWGGILDSVFDRAREMFWVCAVVWGAEFSPRATMPALLCLTGSQLYFYAADGPIRVALAAERQSPLRWKFTLGPFGDNPTRIKLGLFEPYVYALPLGVALGWEIETLWGAGVVFWAALAWKLARAR